MQFPPIGPLPAMSCTTVAPPPTPCRQPITQVRKRGCGRVAAPDLQEIAMKLRFALLGILIALFVAPAFADSIQFDNKGIFTATGGSSGINVVSFLNQVRLNGQIVGSGDLGTIGFTTGNFTGSLLGGGQFGAGTFDITLKGQGTVLSANNFVGFWTKLSDDSYKLVGTFSVPMNGSNFSGTTTQYFEL